MHDHTSVHHSELARLGVTVGSLVVAAALTYVVPGLEGGRPWIAGEAVPIVGLFVDDVAVVEVEDGRLEAVPTPVDGPVEPPMLTSTVPAAAAARGVLPSRPPAVATALVQPEALDAWFRQLARVEDDEPDLVVKALHWGDSTIAGDGITRTVRARLQERFGDGGPGFLAVHVDPRWALRPGVARWPKGPWETLTITFGGTDSARYGLAGTVSTAPPGEEAKSTLGGVQIDGERQLLQRFDLHYQRQPGGGTLVVGTRGGGATLATASDTTHDAFRMITAPAGAPYVTVTAKGDGPVTVYGVALEARGPGVTWETLGVAGSSIGSLMRQSRRHLAEQVARRDPDLVVVMTGGNEVGYASLTAGEGEGYVEAYVKALERLRAGAPDASCLVIAPLDQALRERGQVVSKPALPRMVALQERLAVAQGCAFWNAWRAMGGEGSYARWMNHQPRLAWPDLMHLSDDGLDLVGESLADALLAAYDAWKVHPAAVQRPTGQVP